MNVNDICDYILVRSVELGMVVNLMKLHKLVYYAEAWWMARSGEALTGSPFQAWMHGPISLELQDRFRIRKKGFYARMDKKDTQTGFDPDSLPKEVRGHLDSVLKLYAQFNGSQLEEIVCSEAPWIDARGDCKRSEQSTTEIDSSLMKNFYAGVFKANSDRIPVPQPLTVEQ